MKSIFYRATGRHVTNRAQVLALPAHCIVRQNQVFEAEVLEDTRGLSLRKNGGGRMNSLDSMAGLQMDQLDLRLNAAGDSIELSTGYQIAIDTLTFRVRDIIQQKFYQVAPADFLPVMVGEGAFSDNLLFNRTFSVSDDFEAGNMQTSSSDARMSTADVAIDGLTQKVMDWGKTIGYSIVEVEKALRANNWDVIMAKHMARKQNFDLGIQKIAFLGSVNDTRFPGLLTNPAITVNTSFITKYIRTMTASELQTFVGGLVANFFQNSGFTALPDTFIMPSLDLLGATVLVPGTVGTYPVPLIEYLQSAFERAVKGMGMVQSATKPFTIKGLAYADSVNNPAAKNYYILYRNDPQTLRMNVPVPYTVTQANSVNNFMFHDVAYAEYTGVIILRGLEVQIFNF